MKHNPYCVIQNENTRETFVWFGQNEFDGRWLKLGEREFDGFKELNEILFNSKNPSETLYTIASEFNSN